MFALTNSIFLDAFPGNNSEVMGDIYIIISVVFMAVTAFGKKVASYQPLMSTYNIDVIFMTKKEQVQYFFARKALIGGLIWLAYLLPGLLGVQEKQLISLREIIIPTIIAIIINILILHFTNRTKKGEIVEILKLAIVLLVGMSINYGCGWLIEKSISSCVIVFWVSIATTLIGCEILFNIIKNKMSSGFAKMYYVDKEKCKKMYIFWRFDDENCVVGEAENIEECEEQYLESLQKLKKRALYNVRNKRESTEMNYSRVFIEKENGKQMSVENILSKLNEKNISVDVIEKVEVYIKPSEGKAYYNIPGREAGAVNLFEE